MKQCAWCQEKGSLIPVVNRNPISLSDIDWVCSSCAEVECFEHMDELLWSPLGFTPQRKISTTAHQNERLAS